MVKSSLDELAKVEDVEIIWKSFELRPLGAPPMPKAQEEAYKERIADAWPRTKQTAKDHFGVDMEHHRWGIKSRIALEGAKYAEEKGFGEPYHEAMFKAHFIEDRDFGDVEVLGDLAVEIGLDREEFSAAIEKDLYSEQVDQDVTQAHNYGIQGVPGIIIEEKYFVSGAQPFEALKEIVQKVKDAESNNA